MTEKEFWITVRQALIILISALCKRYGLPMMVQTKRGGEFPEPTDQRDWRAEMFARSLVILVKGIERKFDLRQSTIK